MIVATSTIDSLKARWRTHVQMLGNFNAEIVGRTFDRLCASYAEPQRHYHTLSHLTALFDCLELHADEIGEPARLAFAAWYHDIVYDPRRTDNEAKSAERAMKELDDLGGDSDLRSRVVQLILATKNHLAGGRDYDDDIFLDADLAILGSTEDVYLKYVHDVRAEYAHVSDAEWKTGRRAFLKKLAVAPRIFRTGIFEGAYGDQARANIAWELTTLEAGSAA
ncbi:MAG: metal-dependent phosphohydrolase [Alphaproteobacteria bacterium]|nr:metal-dependent phosphohydrolase [Alphaproteobacteria bacterium]